MRKVAFGYSTRCNIRCTHCVAAGDVPDSQKMDLLEAKDILRAMAEAGVAGISFTAGEPFIFFDDLLELIALCRELNIYTRVVTNSYWAKSPELARHHLGQLKQRGLSQLRMSFSRWHQQHVPRQNVLNAARACEETAVDCFISFVTDFSSADDEYEQFLRDGELRYFPEPFIYAGRADSFSRNKICTDYQENRCAMNPYLAPDLTMYACCDAGSHFNTTHFFKLGSLRDHTVDQLLTKSETHPLYNYIRSVGITSLASFVGFQAREIITYRKCELCKMMFDSPKTLTIFQQASGSDLQKLAR